MSSRTWRHLMFGLPLLFATTIQCLAQSVASDPPTILREVRIDQRLDQQLPLSLTFRDESGKPVKLGDYFGEKPVLLSLVYYRCPMLCTLVLNGELRALRAVPLTIGREFDVVTVSIDPRETPELAAAKKSEYLRKYKRAGAETGWHFLTGDEKSIRQLAEAVGYRYTYDPETGQYAHAAGIMVATPRGKLSKYFYGIEYSARDLRLGLVEAGENRIGSIADQILLFCFHYDPMTGKYGLAVMNVLRAAGVATVAGLGMFVVLMLRRERKSLEPTTHAT